MIQNPNPSSQQMSQRLGPRSWRPTCGFVADVMIASDRRAASGLFNNETEFNNEVWELFSQQRSEYKEEHGENMGTQPFC